jgi:hypothetical protein
VKSGQAQAPVAVPTRAIRQRFELHGFYERRNGLVSNLGRSFLVQNWRLVKRAVGQLLLGAQVRGALSDYGVLHA